MKYSLRFSGFELIIPEGILTIGKLQDLISNRDGHSTGQTQKRKAKASWGTHRSAEGERREEKILSQVN